MKLFNVQVEPVHRDANYTVLEEGPKEITWRWEIREVESPFPSQEELKMGRALIGGYDKDYEAARKEALKWCDAYAKALNIQYAARSDGGS